MKALALALVLVALPSLAAVKPGPPPKLVLVVVIDQFRADYLTRYGNRFLPAGGGKTKLGGFNYLIERGAWYPQAQYQMLQNMTGPGHATVLGGAYPHASGIPVNEWYDRAKRAPVYCVEDAAFGWIGGTAGAHDGTSPKNLLGTTVGDELKGISPASRVVSLALKDRAAIFLGGQRADAVIWMDPVRFQWTSTKRYFPDGALPAWVEKVNGTLRERREKPLPILGGARVAAKDGLFPGGLTWGDKATAATPAGLDLTAELAEAAVTAYGLGQGKASDLLAVSFSSHDYAGHTYGPDSPAMEAMTAADDAVLARLFNFLDQRLKGGMKDVVVVLTADHGVAPNPELLRLRKVDAGRIDENALEAKLEKRLATRFGKTDGKWVLQVKEMNVYLSPAALADKGVDATAAEEETKAELRQTEGIADAFGAADVRLRRLPPGLTEKQILNTYFPGRSGDVVAIVKPFWISDDVTAGHQTGYSYDRTVPLLFAGARIKPGQYAESAEIIDIAPTLAFLLGTVPPSLSEGRVLSEILAR